MTKKRSATSRRARREQYEAQQRRRRRLYYGGAAATLIIFIALFAVLRQVTAPTIEDVTLPDSLEVPPEADGKAWGPADAPVLIEEFGDFQ